MDSYFTLKSYWDDLGLGFYNWYHSEAHVVLHEVRLGQWYWAMIMQYIAKFELDFVRMQTSKGDVNVIPHLPHICGRNDDA